MNLPSPGRFLVAARRSTPSLHVSPKEKAALEPVSSSETQMQFADFSENGVETILIPGST